MGFFSKLFGSRDNKHPLPGSNTAPPASATKPDYTFYKNVATMLVSDTILLTALNNLLKKAFEDPESFFDDDGEFTLSDRGLTYPEALPLVPKFVLIDTLMEHNLMAEVDWKEEEAEVRFAVNRILKAKNYSFTLSEADRYIGEQTFEVIELINDNELQTAGYSLEMLDIDSDSNVFTIVPVDRQTAVAAMFTRLK